jgi:alpha-1,2-mannosyltransferase
MRPSRLTPVLVVVAAAAVVGALHPGLTDLQVYRYGGDALLQGRSALADHDPVTGLPFTYPPFAAVAFVPLAVVPTWLAAAALTAASIAALAVVVALVRPAPWWTVALLTVAALALEPVWRNLAFGQVNLLLMLLVVADLARPERRWSGVLVGVAAGIKLTPLVFVVLLVLVGRRWVAGRAALAFAGTVAVGFLLAPGWSAAYWSDRVIDPKRVGPSSLAHNQSVHGALTRLLDGQPSTLLWLAVAAPVALAVLLVGVGCWRRGEPLLGTCVAALAMLIASPISWSHHWVWAVPLALLLWERSRWTAIVWTAVFVAQPMTWLPWGERREFGWTPIQHVVGNAYLLAALGVAVVLAPWAAGGLRRARDGRGVSAREPSRGRLQEFP